MAEGKTVPKAFAGKAVDDGSKKEKARGSSDEVEIIKIIVNENKGLQNRVLEKIRAYITNNGLTKPSLDDDDKKKK